MSFYQPLMSRSVWFFACVLIVVSNSPLLGYEGQQAVLVSQQMLLDISDGECFEAYADTPGLLFLDVSPLAEGASLARIDLVGYGDSDLARKKLFRSVDRTASSLIAEVLIAGDYRFCVEAQNPEKTLGQTRLTVGFVALSPAVKGGDPDVEEEEPDPTPKTSSPGDNRASHQQAIDTLCRELEDDDHGDVWRCATDLELGRILRSELRDASGHDEDVFAVTVDRFATLVLEVTSQMEIEGALFDQRGQRLHVTLDIVENGFRSVQTLSPGTYYMKVWPRFGDEGTYAVQATMIDH